ncbi:amino acid/polyamine/organocation transporter (APC superfamily) [Tamaricihabitans halophyticus]|uniref:Amino acid/polyamine/organocation transporter (APC superfamily) n=1 Tax=Tamaricihabitans halophyticus TaxID=1262583 RepID=A0A4V2SRQ5_9PSEU|nr:amino acid permease [Tamaricihabitans halophyticus]TCP43876.1 amino acid/polyamine/organocation transporter (APC superfamily) [Tamaricihabitans halophyticus]
MSSSSAEQSSTADTMDADTARLKELGYTSEFRRDMSLWANFSLGFTYLSPVVGIYTLFAFALATAGPPMIWSLLIVGLGQLLVALVFGEIVSQYPLAGGVYPWARRLWGRRWAWLTGWVYMIALLVTVASVAYGAGPYVAMLLGLQPGTNTTILCALAILVLATAVNMGGTRALGLAAIIGFSTEILGALAVGGWLLFAERQHGIGVLFDSFGAASGDSYLAAFLAAGLIGIFQYYGFEACGDVAEEVPNPAKRIPKSMRMTIYVGGFAATFVCLALILSVPDFGAVISGADPDPVTTVLNTAFGTVGSKIVLLVVLVSFLSCALALQAAASRLIYSYARDRMLPASQLFARFSARLHIPPYALLVAAVVPALVVLASRISVDATERIISFAVLGIYLGFQMVVLAALRARLRGWVPRGQFTLGRWGLLVNVLALGYGVAAIVNMVWPRSPEAPWYDNYLTLLAGVLVVGSGVVLLVTTRPYGRSDAPAGDAIPETPERTVDSR